MTVQNSFTSWQTSPKQPDPKRCSPLLETLTAYLMSRWGGANLGCYAKRPVVGGSSISSHASGAAADWRYQDPGPGRAVLLDEVLPWLLNNSKELGVNAVHDYAGDRIWRPPGQSGRATEVSPDCGWKKQNGSGGQMGQSWATWIHVEVHPDRWDDTRTVEQMLDSGIVVPDPEPEGDDDMPTWIAKHPTETRWAISRGGFGRRESTVPDDVDVWITDRVRAGNPLIDLDTGGEVTKRADVTDAKNWEKRMGPLLA